MVMCAVATCSTRSGRDKGVCMFRFPKDSKLKQTWFIKCRRKNYIVNEHSRVCEKHFDDSDFVVSRAFAASLGYNMNFRLQLKPDAVPVTIPEPKSKIPPSSKRKQPPKSMTWEKRRRLETVRELMAQRESLPASDGSECENLSDKFLEEAMDPKVKEIGLHVCPESNTVCTQTTREVVGKRHVKVQTKTGTIRSKRLKVGKSIFGKVYFPREKQPTYNAAACAGARQRPPPLSACEKQISKDEALSRHAPRFNASCMC